MVFQKINRTFLFTCSFFILVWAYSFLFTDDYRNWLIENLLVFLFLPFLLFTQKKIPFDSMSYLCMFSFLSFHVMGSMYAYASVPLGFELKELFHLSRNPYDRIVHFSFGFLFAYPIKNFLESCFQVKGWRQRWMPIEIILSLSAFFELIEWIIGGVLMPNSAETYVGTQGDIWDAQKDMALATLGAAITMASHYVFQKMNDVFTSSTLHSHGKSF